MHLTNTEHLHIPDSGSMHGDKDPKVSKADKDPPRGFYSREESDASIQPQVNRLGVLTPFWGVGAELSEESQAASADLKSKREEGWLTRSRGRAPQRQVSRCQRWREGSGQ